MMNFRVFSQFGVVGFGAQGSGERSNRNRAPMRKPAGNSANIFDFHLSFTKIILDGMTEYHYIIAKMKEKKSTLPGEGQGLNTRRPEGQEDENEL